MEYFIFEFSSGTLGQVYSGAAPVYQIQLCNLQATLQNRNTNCFNIFSVDWYMTNFCFSVQVWPVKQKYTVKIEQILFL